MKICTIVGARPQFVKAAAISRALREDASVEEVMIHTGQHYDHIMSDVFFSELGIAVPQYNLGVGSGLHGAQTGQMLDKIEQVIMKERPDWMLVYGDTNSTLAGALAAAKLHIPVAHVEAGLRSFNRTMPEEINRIATDSISDCLFAPTQAALQQLLIEGHRPDTVVFSGDVMLDVFNETLNQARQTSEILTKLNLTQDGFALATIHRAENTDRPEILQRIFEGIEGLNRTLPVVCPLHPRTAAALSQAGLLERLHSTITLLDPVGYLDMLSLLHGSRLVVTDSGGLQKEAFFSKTPCITLRAETEWTELVEGGWNILMPPTHEMNITEVFSNPKAFRFDPITPYGEGRAAHVIAKTVLGAKMGS